MPKGYRPIRGPSNMTRCISVNTNHHIKQSKVHNEENGQQGFPPPQQAVNKQPDQGQQWAFSEKNPRTITHSALCITLHSAAHSPPGKKVNDCFRILSQKSHLAICIFLLGFKCPSLTVTRMTCF